MASKVDMRYGNIYSKLLIFALPLVIGSIFQLTYNLFDYIVLGWFSLDKIAAQAAVGAANPIMNIFISGISGLCVGAGIHSSELYGKNDITNLKRQFTSCLIAGGIAILLVSLLFILLLNPIMDLSNVSGTELRSQVRTYLTIVGIGYIFSFIYNVYASYLRSMGDSMSSLIFLIVSCVLNVCFNLLFVIVFKMDVTGVAIGTTIAQFFSALSIVVYAKVRYKEACRFTLKEYVVDKSLLKISASYGVASMLQQLVLFVGKYIISTQVNKFDDEYIVAFTSSTSVDQFFFAPAQNFGHAAAIFIAQNKGANNPKRARKGFLAGFSMNMIYGCIITLILIFFRKNLLNLFISSDESIASQKDLVISLGMDYLNIMCFLYFFPCITNSLQSWFRGIGKLNFVFYSTLVQIIFRVGSAVLLINLTGNPLSSTAYGTGIGWLFMIAFELPLVIIYFKSGKNLIKENVTEN